MIQLDLFQTDKSLTNHQDSQVVSLNSGLDVGDRVLIVRSHWIGQDRLAEVTDFTSEPDLFWGRLLPLRKGEDRILLKASEVQRLTLEQADKVLDEYENKLAANRAKAEAFNQAHPLVLESLAMLRCYPRAEKWIINLYHLGQHGFIRGTDLMSLLSRNGSHNIEPGVSADRILAAMENERVLLRGNIDLTGDLAFSSAAFSTLTVGTKVGDNLRHFAWGQGENFAALINAMRYFDAPTQPH